MLNSDKEIQGFPHSHRGGGNEGQGKEGYVSDSHSAAHSQTHGSTKRKILGAVCV